MKTTTNFCAIVRESRNFAVAIDQLKDQGLSRGRAILIARKYDGKGYNEWMRRRQATDDGRTLRYQTL